MNSAEGFEIEAKLVAPDWAQLTQLPAALEAMGAYVSDSEEQQFADHYLDTADLHLLRAGWALRWRNYAGRSVITLKGLRKPVDGVSVREEIEEEIRGSLEDGLPVEVLGGRVKEIVKRADLQLLFSLEQSRSVRQAVFSTGFKLNVCCDQIRWSGAAEVDEEFVAELEVQEGTEDQLRALLARLLESLDWETSTTSKFERGMEVAGLA